MILLTVLLAVGLGFGIGGLVTAHCNDRLIRDIGESLDRIDAHLRKAGLLETDDQ